VPEAVEASVTRDAVSGLLFPYGIASLDPRHPDFHPRHENPDFHHKDAAYHNGTIWGWNAGYTVTALNKFGRQDLAWKLTQNLADQILHAGVRGTMSELVDALPDDAGQPRPSGTYAQAWSVAEFARNAYQDFLGFRPDLLQDRLHFVPALPEAWESLAARLPYGRGEALDLAVRKTGKTWRWTFSAAQRKTRELVLDLLAEDGSRRRVRFPQNGKIQVLAWDGRIATLDGAPLPATLVMESQKHRLADLDFAAPPPPVPAHFPVLRARDVLQRKLLNQTASAPEKDNNHEP
jgi:hypothetical protein